MDLLTRRLTISFSRRTAFNGSSCWEARHTLLGGFFSVLLFEYILTHFSTLNYELGHYRDVFLAAIIFFLALFYHSTH